MEPIFCVILAAGLGKRLGGDLPKAIAETREGPLLELGLKTLAALKPVKTVIVVGHKRELIEQHISKSAAAKDHVIEYAYQEEQLGTGHAVRCVLPHLSDCRGTVILTYADHPLFTPETLTHFIAHHNFKKATLSMISFSAAPPHGYGRIIRGANNQVLRITEARDCNPEELLIPEVNSGVYAVDSSFLKPAIEELTNENAQKEYYLTDIVAKASKEGQTVCAFPLGDAREAAGVNTLTDLAEINAVLAERQVRRLQLSGVVFDQPSTCSIDSTVSIEPGARIGPQVQLRGTTSIGRNVVVEGSSLILNSTIRAGAQIRLASRIEDSVVGEGSTVGPFAHIRPGTNLGANCRIGNFVETKNATLADGAKASHLTYLGDCTVGVDSNIGAGTITCNYDGYSKSTTTIGSGVFIGSNSSLVAPVEIGDGALVAAGSTITKNVPADAIAVGRAEQVNKSDRARARRDALEKRRGSK